MAETGPAFLQDIMDLDAGQLCGPGDLPRYLELLYAATHLAGLGIQLGSGRAAAAPTLGSLGPPREREHEATRRSNRFTKTHPADFLGSSLRGLHPWLASVIGANAALGTTLAERA